MPSHFDRDGVDALLSGHLFAGKIHHLVRTDSTNAVALREAQDGALHGSVWVADEQTAGRGRGGHSWHSRPGDGLYMSLLVRPRLDLNKALWLSLATGMAVQTAIEQVTGVKPDIRWPNDVLIGEKKCCGILVETATAPSAGTGIRYAVIGIGINVNHERFPEELSELATSLRMETGVSWQRETLLAAVLINMEQELKRLEEELAGTSTGETLLGRFAEASSWVRGKRVTVAESGGYSGETIGLDAQGFLQVADEDGSVRTVLSGGVRSE